MLDFAAEIRTIWQISNTELASISFAASNDVCGTIPRLRRDNRLEIEVRCNPSKVDDILFHEGAHVYLFHLKYPPCRFISITGTDFFTMPIDFVAEFYATKLELQRRYQSTSSRIRELGRRLENATTRIPLQAVDYAPQRGAGDIAIQAAFCSYLCDEWSLLELRRNSESIMAGALHKVRNAYTEVINALRQIPHLPDDRSFNDSEIQAIVAVLQASFDRLYDGIWRIQAPVGFFGLSAAASAARLLAD